MASPMDMTLGQFWPYLVMVGSVVSALAWAFNRLYRLRRDIEGKQPVAACLKCRREVDGMIADKAARVEVGAFQERLAELEKAVVELRTQSAAIFQTVTRMDDKIERMLERESSSYCSPSSIGAR